MMSRLIVLSLYAAVAAAVAALIFLGHRSTKPLLPFAELLQTIMIHRSVRVVVMLFWWWVGWHFLIEP